MSDFDSIGIDTIDDVLAEADLLSQAVGLLVALATPCAWCGNGEGHAEGCELDAFFVRVTARYPYFTPS